MDKSEGGEVVNTKAVRVEVQVDSSKSMITGRNGEFDIKAIAVWGSAGRVFLDGIGKRGSAIRGGMSFPTDKMDELARGWLKSRGLTLEEES